MRAESPIQSSIAGTVVESGFQPSFMFALRTRGVAPGCVEGAPSVLSASSWRDQGAWIHRYVWRDQGAWIHKYVGDSPTVTVTSPPLAVNVAFATSVLLEDTVDQRLIHQHEGRPLP
jgi:hypothetical protein